MLNRLAIATVVALLIGLSGVGTAAATPHRPATPPPTDFWQNKHFMNIAHEGGETEAPANTLFALKTAVADRGADALAMEGYLTQDGAFVVTHDLDPYKTSNAPGTGDPPARAANQIKNQTLAQLKQLDFAYKFRPGTGHYGYPHDGAPAGDYIYRGIATGDVDPPVGYTANDLRIATFREVLDALPDTPMSIEMKAPEGQPELTTDVAEALAGIMEDYPERSEDVIVTSSLPDGITEFHEADPDHKALGAEGSEMSSYIGTFGENPIVPTPVALQEPDHYVFGGSLFPDSLPILRENATYDGFAIQIYPNNVPDYEMTWEKVVIQGGDGFITDKPGDLHDYLCETGIPRPDGSLRCAQQQCPEGQFGVAPNCKDNPVFEPCPEGWTGVRPNCVETPTECPEGQTGIPPHCSIVIVDPVASVSRLAFARTSGKVRVGRKRRLTIKVSARNDGLGATVSIRLKSSNRRVKVPKTVKVGLRPGYTARKTFTVKAKRHARGRATIKATTSGKTARAVLRVVARRGS